MAFLVKMSSSLQNEKNESHACLLIGIQTNDCSYCYFAWTIRRYFVQLNSSRKQITVWIINMRYNNCIFNLTDFQFANIQFSQIFYKLSSPYWLTENLRIYRDKLWIIFMYWYFYSYLPSNCHKEHPAEFWWNVTNSKKKIHSWYRSNM